MKTLWELQRHASASEILGPSTTNECSFAHQRPSCPIVLQMVSLQSRRLRNRRYRNVGFLRIAHLLCELSVRLRAIGRTHGRQRGSYSSLTAVLSGSRLVVLRHKIRRTFLLYLLAQ